jgi:hypothetical protein
MKKFISAAEARALYQPNVKLQKCLDLVSTAIEAAATLRTQTKVHLYDCPKVLQEATVRALQANGYAISVRECTPEELEDDLGDDFQENPTWELTIEWS